MYVASMDTENFNFLAVGTTAAEATDAMIQTMRRHRTQYGAETWHPGRYPGSHNDCGGAEYPDDDAGWLHWLADEWYGCRVSGPYKPGCAGTRDGEPIYLRED